jgi:hypothetical protein
MTVPLPKFGRMREYDVLPKKISLISWTWAQEMFLDSKTAIIHYFYVVVIILTAQNQNVSYSTEDGALFLLLGTMNISTDT